MRIFVNKFRRAKKWASFKLTAIITIVASLKDFWLPMARDYLPSYWVSILFVLVMLAAIYEESGEEHKE